MATALTLPPYTPAPEHHEPGGVFDLFGRELSHAAHAQLLRSLFERHPGLVQLVKHAAAHADDLAHEAHADLADAFSAHIKGLWRIERFAAPIEWYAKRLPEVAAGHVAFDESDPHAFHKLPTALRIQVDAAMRRDQRSYDTSEFEDTFENLFTTAGVSALWNQAANGGVANSGAAVPKLNAWYNNAQAVLGVGDSSTAATNSQFDLQAASNRLWVAMDATYPTLPASGSNQVVFRATFGGAQALYAWSEFAIANDGGSNVTIPGSAARSAPSGSNNGNMLDRVVSSQGTKGGSTTWVPSMTESIS